MQPRVEALFEQLQIDAEEFEASLPQPEDQDDHPLRAVECEILSLFQVALARRTTLDAVTALAVPTS